MNCLHNSIFAFGGLVMLTSFCFVLYYDFSSSSMPPGNYTALVSLDKKSRFPDAFTRILSIGENETINLLNQTLLDRTHMPNVKMVPYFEGKKRFERCALVGSSDILMYNEFGAEIDRHDAVFRCGFAPTGMSNRNLTRHVGTKTTFRIISCPFHLCLTDDPKVDPVIKSTDYPNRIRDYHKHCAEPSDVLLYLLNFKRGGEPLSYIQSLQRKYPYRAIFVMDQHFVHKVLQPRIEPAMGYTARNRMSSGSQYVIISLAMCNELDLYGFYPYEKSPGGHHLEYKYYATDGTRKNNQTFDSWHAFSIENKYILGLHKQGFPVRVFIGNRK